MSCCPPDSEPYLAATYATVGSVGRVEGTEIEYYQTGDATATKSIVFIPDIFGWNAGRTRNLADWFGNAGFYVIVPKLLVPALNGGTDGDGTPYPLVISCSNCWFRRLSWVREYQS